MAVININAVAKLVENNPKMRGVVSWFIRATLHLLEAQKLIDFRKLESVSLDWDRGTLYLGNNFTEQLVARAVSEYVINKRKKVKEFELRSKLEEAKDSLRRKG